MSTLAQHEFEDFCWSGTQHRWNVPAKSQNHTFSRSSEVMIGAFVFVTLQSQTYAPLCCGMAIDRPIFF